MRYTKSSIATLHAPVFSGTELCMVETIFASIICSGTA